MMILMIMVYVMIQDVHSMMIAAFVLEVVLVIHQMVTRIVMVIVLEMLL